MYSATTYVNFPKFELLKKIRICTFLNKLKIVKNKNE